jgi:hypothetical protein
MEPAGPPVTPPGMIRRALLAVALLAVAGCTTSPSASPSAPSAPSAPAPSGPAPSSAAPAACATVSTEPLTERQGTGSLWALFFPTAEGPGVVAGREAKIVWKIAGSGNFTISATGPGGATTLPSWGPSAHGSSTWERPGAEWGTGWIFPAAGCWTVHATTSDGAKGELTLAVTA